MVKLGVSLINLWNFFLRQQMQLGCWKESTITRNLLFCYNYVAWKNPTIKSLKNVIFFLIVFLLSCLITDKDVKQIQVVKTDLQNSLNILWDELPIDTVVASLLDPRTKWFRRIPKGEIAEALAMLKKVLYLRRK